MQYKTIYVYLSHILVYSYNYVEADIMEALHMKSYR